MMSFMHPRFTVLLNDSRRLCIWDQLCEGSTIKHIAIGLHRENAIAIKSEARDSLNVQSKADRRAFAHKERNLHCDVHVAAENKHTLPPFGSLDSFWIMRSQRSRRRDKSLLFLLRN